MLSRTRRGRRALGWGLPSYPTTRYINRPCVVCAVIKVTSVPENLSFFSWGQGCSSRPVTMALADHARRDALHSRRTSIIFMFKQLAYMISICILSCKGDDLLRAGKADCRGAGQAPDERHSGWPPRPSPARSAALCRCSQSQ